MWQKKGRVVEVTKDVIDATGIGQPCHPEAQPKDPQPEEVPFAAGQPCHPEAQPKDPQPEEVPFAAGQPCHPEAQPKDPQPEEEKKRRKIAGRLVRLALLALLIVSSVIILHEFGLIKYPWEKDTAAVVAGDLFPGAGGAADGHLPDMTQDEIMEQMQRVADASMFSFKINSRPTFAHGSAPGDLRIENPSYNTYPMVVQIFLKGSDTLIFDSGGIMPNQYIDNAKLIKPLSAGTYEATAVFNAYNPENGEWQGKAQAGMIITVQG